MAAAARAADHITVVWEPQRGPQTALVTCPTFEVFYGGARGGGKTDGVLGEWVSHADQYGVNAIGLMVRRSRTQLVETIERSRQLYGPLGAVYHEQDKMWRFPNGARLRFAYLERDADADGYQGHSYTRVYVEEIGTFPTAGPVLKLMATLRSGAGVPVGFRATGNPGGPGQAWVKARYIDPAPGGWQIIPSEFRNPWTGEAVVRERVYIPSKLQDNRYLGSEYVANLYMSGSEALVRAWLEGDWSAVEGAFFDGWRTERHVVSPFLIPDHWLRFRSFDWGYGAPFSVGWWAVASEPRGTIPRGCLIRYQEWYGASEPNIGLRLEAEDIARGIIAREKGQTVGYGVADTQIFAQDGKAYGYLGPTIGERINKTLGAAGAPIFRPADKSRSQGWDQMRARLHGDLDGNPMLVVFDSCADFIRTVPVLQHDVIKPEDLDTDAEDHVADEARYGCMSRPWARPTPQPEQSGIVVKRPTMREVMQAHERSKRNSDARRI